MAAIGFGLAGTLAATASSATLSITAPACSVGDLMIAAIMSKDNQAWTPPSGWTVLAAQTNNTANQTAVAYWKYCAPGDPSAVFAFTKATNNSIVSAGVIYSYTSPNVPNPFCAATPIFTATAVANDLVSFGDYNINMSGIPEQNANQKSLAIAIAFYNLNQCTFLAPTGWSTDIINVTENDAQSTALGTTCTISHALGANFSRPGQSGAATQASQSVTDDISLGLIFGLTTRNEQSGTAAQNSRLSQGDKYPSLPEPARIRQRLGPRDRMRGDL